MSNLSCGVIELADNKYVSIQIVLCVVLCFKKALENTLVLRYEKFHSAL